MRKRRRLVPVLAFLSALVFLITAVLRTRINPLIERLAVAAVADAASNEINDAVVRQFAEEDVQYRDLITLERDNAGAVTALTTNMQEMNRLKTGLLKQLDHEIYGLNAAQISIPVGNLTGIELLSGRGPGIPVRIVSVSSSDAQFLGEFSEAGINQTMHRVILNVSLELLVLLPAGTVTEQVSSDICVAETVLLGPVPESYTYFNSADGAGGAMYFHSGE